jgi:hypothetical protein
MFARGVVMRVGTLVAALWLGAETVGWAAGCPVCSSGTGRQVRAGLVDGNMGVSVLATVLPFVVLGGVVAGIHFVGGKTRAPQAGRPKEGDGKGVRDERRD